MTDPLDIIAPGIRQAAQNARVTDSIARHESERGAREAALGRDVDPNYVNSMENFEGLSHAEMYKGAQEMMPGVINEAVGKWGNIGTALTFANARFKQGITSAMAGKWEGLAADAATQSVVTFTDSCDVFQRSVYAITDRLMEVGQAAQIVKSSVPPPPVQTPLQLIAGLHDVAAVEAQKAAEEAAHREAVRVMTTHYQPTYQRAGDNVPRFTAPQGVPGIDGGGGSAPGGGSSPGGGGSGFASPSSGGGGAQGADGSNATGQDQGAPGAGDGTSNGQPQGQSAADDAATRASSAADGAGNAAGNQSAAANQNADAANRAGAGGANTGGYPGGLAGMAGGAGGAGRGGAAAGGGGGLGRGGLASSGAGAGARGGLTPNSLSGNATGPEGGRVGGAAAAAGRPGAPGMGGMAPHGRKGNGDEDDEHKTPSYLVNVDNGNELIGKMRPAAPPVLGAYEQE